MADPSPRPHADRLTRRRFLAASGAGLGALALGDPTRGEELPRPVRAPAELASRGALPALHHAPRAKRAIFLFMAGGPSQLELFEEKPALARLDGQPVPPSFTDGKRFAFIGPDAKLLATRRAFARHGECGAPVSELLPHTAGIVDELCFLRGMVTDEINHGPAKLFVNTGAPTFGRPSLGAWLSWGIGSECADLPGFVVLQSGRRGPRAGAALWGASFLPSRHAGVPLRASGDPILHLASPPGIDATRQRDFVETVGALNRRRLAETGDPEIASRIAAYELAHRMQSAAPELCDLSTESAETLALYGCADGAPSFARNCLLARRLVERGVRFVQLYHTDWDHHGDSDNHLGEPLEAVCRDVDRGGAALVRDLARRGLLEDTLVVWGGEFGRTPMTEVRKRVGRDHHVDAYTLWLAGAGVKKGFSFGETDEIGYGVTAGRVHVHDLQATLLHLFGIDHTRLTFRAQGRDFRLTDVHGEVVREILT